MSTMNPTKNISAREAKNRFGALLDAVQRAPVHITKNGRDVAVILSLEDYRHFEEAEEALWTARARAAEKAGYIGTKKSETLVREILDAHD